MPRPIRSFSQRLSDDEKREALATVTPTEKLLTLILLELMETRGRRGLAERAAMLRRAGFSKPQIAGLLDTSAATLSVVQHRSEVGQAVAAVDPPVTDTGTPSTREKASSS